VILLYAFQDTAPDPHPNTVGENLTGALQILCQEHE